MHKVIHAHLDSLCRAAFVVAAILIVLWINAASAHAANLNYNADVTLPITASGINFVMKSGSTADSLTVNATSVIVAVTAGTSSATLTSASADFTISGTATVTKTCSVTTARVVVTGTGTETLTPAASICTIPGGAPSVFPSGGGGGGTPASTIAASIIATSTVATSTTPLQTATSSTPQMTTPTSPTSQTQVSTLQTQLQSLVRQALIRGKAKNFSLGSKGDYVKLIQLFLINQASGPSAQALSKVGATGKFGSLTKRALIEFQKANGIRPASGYFGPKTRAAIQKLLNP